MIFSNRWKSAGRRRGDVERNFPLLRPVWKSTANGELETKTNTATSETTAYTYDVLGNLKSVIFPDATVIDYVVDGRNRRIGKKVNGTLERSWIYDGQLRPVAELDGTGTLTAQYVYATHINVPD